jgi:Uma2 family endonuclease
MASTVQARNHKVTYQEYASWPDDGKRYEVLGGEVFVSPSPFRRHQRVVLRLGSLLQAWFDRTGAGEAFVSPFDVVLGRFDVVQPDVLAVSRRNMRVLRQRGVFGAPDLAVEVLSPGSIRHDTVRKHALYERRGVRELWIVDPVRRTLRQYARKGARLAPIALHRGAATFGSTAFPGLVVPLAEAWRRPGRR